MAVVQTADISRDLLIGGFFALLAVGSLVTLFRGPDATTRLFALGLGAAAGAGAWWLLPAAIHDLKQVWSGGQDGS